MKMPVTQFWDSRLLYIYALLSGYVQTDVEKLHKLLDTFIKYPSNQDYCAAVLQNLATEAKIESVDSPFQNADTKWFKDMIKSYVGYFQADRMFAPTGNSTTIYAQHHTRLLNRIGKTATTRSVLGQQSSNSKKFLETLLSLASQKQIIIESVSPTDETCQKFIAKVCRTSDAPYEQSMYVEAIIDGTQVYIGIKGKDLLPLGSPLRFGGAAYNFMHYMQTHTNQTVSKLDIQELDYCGTKNDMTELVRAARFDKQLKKIFFEGTTKSGVRFTPIKSLSGDDLKAFKLRLKMLRS